jgi:hypothetical protein
MKNGRAMTFLKNLRLRIHRRLLRQALRRQRRQPQNTNLSSAQTVGILFDATELSEREIVLRYAESLRGDGKKVRLLGYFHGDQHNPNFTFRHYNRKQFDWALRPSSTEVKIFLREPLDLLLNLEVKTRPHTEYIAALAQAKLKVGPATENTYCYDLMLEPADHADLATFIKQVESLLQITNTRNEPAKL